MKRKLLLIMFLSFVLANARAQVVSTIAGISGLSGTADGNSSTARFNNPHGIAADKSGNIFIADRYNHKIRKISTSGVVTTIAGSGAIGSTDGQGLSATFNEPWGITCDTLGNLYIADTKNYKIRKIDATGMVSTIAGAGVFGTTNGPNNVARFGFSSGITVTADGTTIYVADYNTHVIRKIYGGQVTTFAGTIYIAGSSDGLGTAATFNHPYGIELDNFSNILVADEWSNVIRKITPLGQVTTFAGQGIIGSADGTGLAAQFNYPWDITVDKLNNIYVLDGFNFTVRRIAATSNAVTTYVGTPGVSGSADGIGPAAKFDNAAGITFNTADNSLYIADCNNHIIRKITAQSSVQITLAVNGVTTVCYGDSIHLSAAPSGLSNYKVYEGNTLLASSSNGIFSIPALTPGTHILNCNAFDINGATANSNTVTINVLNPFVPVITSPGGNSFCSGDSLLLSAQAGNLYLWSSGSNNQNLYVKSAGTYTVTVTGSNGCKGISNGFSVTQLIPPSAIINSTATTVCPNDSAQLTATATSSWLWSNGATTQTIKVPAGSYVVTVTASNGCTSKSANSVITNYSVSIPTINPPGPLTIIQGDSVLLTASGGTGYQWTGGKTGTGVYVSTGGNFSVSALSTNGCAVTSIPVQVILITSSSLISANGALNFCEGNNVQLNSLLATGNQWFYQGQPIIGAVNQQYLASDSGYYKVGIFTNGHWLYSDSLLVTVYTSPQLPVVSDTVICRGQSVQVQVQNNSGETYHWFTQANGGVEFSNQVVYQTPEINNTTTYYIETVASNGCPSGGRAALQIMVNPSPQVDFNYSTNAQSGQYITTFSNTTIDGLTYKWIFADSSINGNISTDINPVYAYPSAGSYTVMLIAGNNFGCYDTLSRVLDIHGNNSLFIPTTFTPNGDGKNDLFRVRGDQFEFYEMLIYDQWGSLIYHADASKPNWDGKVNGQTVQNGTYVYRIGILDKDKVSKYLTGSITVIK